MCEFSGVLAEGEVLRFQLITLFVVIAIAGAWIYVYASRGLGKQLRLFLFPIALWLVFGTLDILITVRGTFSDPLSEANPATRMLLVQFGNWGAPVASVLWICLWAGVVYLLNRYRPGRASGFVSLAIFYCLAAGHVFGFSSWFIPLCGLSKIGITGWLTPLALAVLHYALAERNGSATEKEKG